MCRLFAVLRGLVLRGLACSTLLWLTPGCAWTSSAPSFGDGDLVDVQLQAADGRIWRISTAPDQTDAEFVRVNGQDAKRATPGEMQVLLERLDDVGFFDQATGDTPDIGGHLTVRMAPRAADGDAATARVWSVPRPISDLEGARRYRRYFDAFHNSGFNRITQMRPSDNPESALRQFQRGTR